MAYPESWLWRAIEAAAGCTAYPAYVIRDAKPPYVAFARIGTNRERHLRGNGGAPVATFAVTAVAGNYLGAKELANRIRLGVDGFAGVSESGVHITSVAMTDEADADPELYAGDEQPTYAVNLVFDVRFTEET